MLATVGRDLARHAAVVGRQLIVGEVTLRTGYVEAVATGTAWRRRGIAGPVMQSAERLITGSFELGALAASEEGASLYLRRGWTPGRAPSRHSRHAGRTDPGRGGPRAGEPRHTGANRRNRYVDLRSEAWGPLVSRLI